MTAALLALNDVHAGYLPGVDILRGLSLNARPNEITLVIGPNGAGKSTLLRTVFAFLAPSQGSIMFRGEPTAGKRASDLKATGISYVTQDINSFPNLTVEENLRICDISRARREAPRARR
jgi:branched-chain amino acid transport system ATP-binding protein